MIGSSIFCDDLVYKSSETCLYDHSRPIPWSAHFRKNRRMISGFYVLKILERRKDAQFKYYVARSSIYAAREDKRGVLFLFGIDRSFLESLIYVV